MTHKVYRWMSPEGRSVSPPPDPFDLQDQTNLEERSIMNEADERKVSGQVCMIHVYARVVMIMWLNYNLLRMADY